jgi:hypothetical protein
MTWFKISMPLRCAPFLHIKCVIIALSAQQRVILNVHTKKVSELNLPNEAFHEYRLNGGGNWEPLQWAPRKRPPWTWCSWSRCLKGVETHNSAVILVLGDGPGWCQEVTERERYTELGHSRLHATAWSATRSAPLTPLFFEYTHIYGDIKHSLAQPRTLRDRDHSDKHFQKEILYSVW